MDTSTTDADGLPTYSVAATDALDDENYIESLIEFGLTLPIMKISSFKSATPEQTMDPNPRIRHMELEIVGSFFEAIEQGNDIAVSAIIARGLVSPDTTSVYLESPLLAAIRVGNNAMVRHLISLGAMVNSYAQPHRLGRRELSSYESWSDDAVERTPLMYAAQTGKLAIVKILMEESGADDALIAPDGGLALRLAGDNGHREVVEYLPLRRGGAMKRWRARHRNELRRIKRAGKVILFVTVGIPTCIIWVIPRYVVWEPLAGAATKLWKNRHVIAAGIRKKFSEIPVLFHRAMSRIMKFIQKIPVLTRRLATWSAKTIKSIPAHFKQFCIDVAKICKAVGKRIWKFIKAIPGVLVLLYEWIAKGIKSLGSAVALVVTRVLSLLHTVVVALGTFMKQITLENIWNAFRSVMHALGQVPASIWRFLVDFGGTLYKIADALFGTLGKVFWWIVRIILWFITAVPIQLTKMMRSVGRVAGQGVHEVRVYLNPKLV